MEKSPEKTEISESPRLNGAFVFAAFLVFASRPIKEVPYNYFDDTLTYFGKPSASARCPGAVGIWCGGWNAAMLHSILRTHPNQSSVLELVETTLYIFNTGAKTEIQIDF